MLTKRIIPCLDIKNGRTVKGVNFLNLKDAGDPIELAVKHVDDGADELVFLDITATEQKRKTLSRLVYNIASKINIPFTYLNCFLAVWSSVILSVFTHLIFTLVLFSTPA